VFAYLPNLQNHSYQRISPDEVVPHSVKSAKSDTRERKKPQTAEQIMLTRIKLSAEKRALWSN